MAKIRWGILGAAKIAREKVIPATQASETGVVRAIASRELSRASAVAGELGIEKAYGSYEALLDDPEVDAVYIPLPNHMHVPWTKHAIEAGKHVLCEKPIAMDHVEAEELLEFDAERPTLVMEALMYRFHPQWITARQLVRDGRTGELHSIHTDFSFNNLDPDNYRNKIAMGGGALLDIGCYPISLSRFLFDDEPSRVISAMNFDSEMGIDVLVSAIMEFGLAVSTFTCSMQRAPYQRVNIFGTTGRIEIEIPFNAPIDRSCRMWVQTDGQANPQIEEIVFDIADQYKLQADAFGRAILNGQPVPTPLEDAVANMTVIDRIRRSAETGDWE